MNENARNILCDMVRQYGRSVIDDPARCKGLLHDFLKNDLRELNVLLGALAEGIPTDLVTSQTGAPPITRIALLAGKLQNSQSLAADAARWAVESWAVALGVVSLDALRRQPESSASLVPKESPPYVAPPLYDDFNLLRGGGSERTDPKPPKPPLPRTQTGSTNNGPEFATDEQRERAGWTMAGCVIVSILSLVWMNQAPFLLLALILAVGMFFLCLYIVVTGKQP